MPFLAPLLFCFSRLYLPCCHVSPHLLPAPFSAAGVIYEQNQPPQLVVSSVLLHLYHVLLSFLGFLWQDTSSPSTISSAHTLSPPSQAEWTLNMSNQQMPWSYLCLTVFFFSLKKQEGTKGEEKAVKQQKVFLDKVWREVGNQRGSEYVWAPYRGLKNHLRFLHSFFFPFSILHSALSSETLHDSIQAVVAAASGEETWRLCLRNKEKKKVVGRRSCKKMWKDV